MIHIVILKGSVRPGNYTSMAAALVEAELKKQNVCPRVTLERLLREEEKPSPHIVGI